MTFILSMLDRFLAFFLVEIPEEVDQKFPEEAHQKWADRQW